MAKILDGKKVAENWLEKIKQRYQSDAIEKQLDIILVGDDFASHQYVKMKREVGQSIGLDVKVHQFEANAQEKEIIDLIEVLNQSLETTGIMVQLPLPSDLDQPKVLNSIDPAKDVDGLTAVNLGRLWQDQNKKSFVSATPLGIMKLLEEYKIDLKGKRVVILGRSPIVGVPLAALMLQQQATITMAHSQTKDLEQLTQSADILVSAIGQANFVKVDMIKEKAVIIDVGTNKDPDSGQLTGDVDFDRVKTKAGYITPVPDGVGPMTVAGLMSNMVFNSQG